MMKTPGDDLMSLLSNAKHDVLIVAPFIRTPPLTRLLDCISPGVITKIITRWRPADLLAGASDLDVFDLTQSRSIPLLLRYDLHAKLFAADDQCFIGSANVTKTALGWRTPANLELLTLVARRTSNIAAFEKELFAGVVYATGEHQQRLRDLVDRLADRPNTIIPEITDDESTPGLLLRNWVPRTKNPEELYHVYSGDHDRVSRTLLPTMKEELIHLGVAPGMDEDDFRAWISAAITQTPLVCGVMRCIDEEGSMTEPVLEQLLKDIDVDTNDYSIREGLLVLQRWLTYFLPAQYQTTQDSIKLIKATDM